MLSWLSDVLVFEKNTLFFGEFRGEVFLTGWVVPSTYRFLYLWNGAMQCTQTKEGTTPDH